MKKTIDTNFARAILILVGALIIFSFWFLTNSMTEDYAQTKSTPVIPTQPNSAGGTPQNARQQESPNAQDPVLQEIDIEELVLDTTVEIDELEDLSEIEDIDFRDLNF